MNAATTPAWTSTDAVTPTLNLGADTPFTLSNLLRLRDEPDVGHTGRVHDREYLRDNPIFDAFVCPEIHAVPRAVLRQRLEDHAELPNGPVRGFPNEDLAVLLYSDREPFLGLERLGLRRWKRDVDAALHHWRGHHEEHDQSKHHVDQAHDVDVG